MIAVYRITIPSDDINRSVEFYREIFETPGWRVSNGRHYFDCSGTIISCYDAVANGDPTVPRANEEYVYFSVDDIDETYGRAQRAGAVLDTTVLPMVGVLGEVQTRPWGERSFYTKDPSGNPLCFAQKETIFSKGSLPA